MRRTFILSGHPEARRRALQCVADAPPESVVKIEPATRSHLQNNLLHSILGDIAARMEWAGKKWDVEDWKRLLTAAWTRTRKQSVAMVPAVDGHGFDVLYHRTSTLTKGEFADLVDFVTAFAVENGIDLGEEHAQTS